MKYGQDYKRGDVCPAGEILQKWGRLSCRGGNLVDSLGLTHRSRQLRRMQIQIVDPE